MTTLRQLLTEACEKNGEKFEEINTIEISPLDPLRKNKYSGNFNALLQALDKKLNHRYYCTAYIPHKSLYYVWRTSVFRSAVETTCSDNLK